MKTDTKATEGGKGAESAEAAAAAADASESNDGGSVETLDDYLAQKDAGPGVLGQSDSEKDEPAEEEESTTEGAEDAEEAAADEDPDADAEETDETDEAEEEDDPEEEHEGLERLTDDERQVVGEIITRKVGKQVAKRKAVEEKLETANSRIEELEQQLEAAPAPKGEAENPLMQAETEAEVDRHETGLKSALREVRRWVDDHDKEDVYTTAEGKEFGWSEVRQYQYDLEDEIADTIPKARQAVAKRQEAEKTAKEKYPKLFDRRSEDYQAMQKILRQVPQLKAMPDCYLHIGRLIAGQKLESAPKKKAAARRKAPPKPNAAKPPETSAPSRSTRQRRAVGEVNKNASTLDEYLG